MPEMICKVHLVNFTSILGAPVEYPGRLVSLWASHDSTLPEDKRLSGTIPTARFEAQINNPSLIPIFLKEDGSVDHGKEFYLTISTEKPE